MKMNLNKKQRKIRTNVVDRADELLEYCGIN